MALKKVQFSTLILVVLFALAITGKVLFGIDPLQPLEYGVYDSMSRLRQRKAATQIIIVAIDDKSVQNIGSWPWPRSYHAQIANSLTMAGADRVAFDVDFSSHSTQPGDAALAEALAAADNPVLLPVFAQMMRGIDGDEQLILTRPLPQFEHGIPERDRRLRKPLDAG